MDAKLVHLLHNVQHVLKIILSWLQVVVVLVPRAVNNAHFRLVQDICVNPVKIITIYL